MEAFYQIVALKNEAARSRRHNQAGDPTPRRGDHAGWSARPPLPAVLFLRLSQDLAADGRVQDVGMA